MRSESIVNSHEFVFPLVLGIERDEGFSHTVFLGTGFFVSQKGLALTAAHVVMRIKAGEHLRAVLPTPDGIQAVELLWKVSLPNSDIAIVRLNAPLTTCLKTTFARPFMGQDVKTLAISESQLIKEPSGKIRVPMRVAKGYLSYIESTAAFASFALPKGMSGAPMIVTNANRPAVQGVFVGQSRGEQIEDQIVEVVDARPESTHRHTESISRVEYFARGDLLAPFKDFTAPEFKSLTLEALIASEIPQPVGK